MVRKIIVSLEDDLTGKYLKQVQKELSGNGITTNDLSILKIIGKTDAASLDAIEAEMKLLALNTSQSLQRLLDTFISLGLISEPKEGIMMFKNSANYSLTPKGILICSFLNAQRYDEAHEEKCQDTCGKTKGSNDKILREFLYRYFFIAGDVDYLFDKFNRNEIINEIKSVVLELFKKDAEADLHKVPNIVMKRLMKRQFDKDIKEISELFAQNTTNTPVSVEIL